MGIFKCDEVLAIINYNRRAVRFCQSEAAPHGKIFCNAVSHFFTCVCALLSVNIFLICIRPLCMKQFIQLWESEWRVWLVTIWTHFVLYFVVSSCNISEVNMCTCVCHDKLRLFSSGFVGAGLPPSNHVAETKYKSCSFSLSLSLYCRWFSIYTIFN